MKVFTAALHHEVLTAWAEYRRQLARAPEVVTLDFHTDVLCSARRGVALPPPGAWQDAGAVALAVSQLRHDEHFDWALHCGMISKAVIVSVSPCAVKPEHPALQVVHDPALPDMMTMLNAPEKFMPFASAVLSDGFLKKQLPAGVPAPGFILDIDCDYILCRKALHPAEHSFFDKLICNAGLITLSREDDWVKILQLPGEKLTGGETAAFLEEYCYALAAPGH